MSAPTATFTAASERGGRLCHTLFELTVTHPTPKTWYLATVDLAPPASGVFSPDTFDPGTFALGWGGAAFWGLVLEHSGVGAAAALGGDGGAGGVTLTLTDALGSGGPRRRFSDAFAANVEGSGEPYDLLTASLVCRLYWPSAPGDPLTVGGALSLLPNGYAWEHAPGEGPRFTLSFAADQRRYRQLPLNAATAARYPHVPDGATGRSIPLWFGEDLRVPLLPMDSDGGLFLIGASPTDTPIGGVTEAWTIRPDPGADDSQDVALPVQLTTGGQLVLSIPATVAGNQTLTQVAQRMELPTGAFIYGLRVRLKRASGGTPCVGSLSGGVLLEADGLPGEGLVDQGATFEVNAAIVTSGSYAEYDLIFQANTGKARAAFIPGRRGVWAYLTYQKTSGDMHIEKDTSGAYANGIMATKATATDEAWNLTGKVVRVGKVRQNFQGGGTLLQNVTTGVITTKAPVTVPGL